MKPITISSIPKVVLFSLLFIFLLPCSILAQDNVQQQKDSLQKILPTLSGKDKLNAYDKLHSIYLTEVTGRQSLNDFLAFSSAYEKEAQKQEDIKRQGDIKINIIIAYFRCNEYEEVKKLAPDIIESLKATKHTEGVFVVLSNLILSYCELLEYDKALTELQQTYDIAKTNDDAEGLFYALYLTGKVYMYQNRYEEAADNYRESLEVAKKSQKHFFNLITAHLELCNMLQVMERFDEYDEMIKESETVLRQIEAQNTTSRTYEQDWGNLWKVQAYAGIQRKDYDKALYFCELLKDSTRASTSDLGEIAYLQANIYKAQGKYEEALEQAEQAIESRPAQLFLRYLKIEILALSENAPRTWIELEKTVVFSDSISKATLKTQLDELRTIYEVDKITAEKEKKQQQVLLAFAICALLLVVLLIYFLYSRRLKQRNLALYQQVQELSRKEKAVESCFLSKPQETLSKEMQLFRQLSELMKTEKLFIDTDINRKKLADRLGTNEIYLANAIRQGRAETFSDYISNLRLQYALDLMENQSEMTFDSIAVDSGHGSYSQFFRSFSKKYGLTPSEYRKMSVKRS